MSHHHHHHHGRDEQYQIDSDEALAARLQAEENTRGPQSGYPGQGYQSGPQQNQGRYQGGGGGGGYQGQPPQGYPGGPPMGSAYPAGGFSGGGGGGGGHQGQGYSGGGQQGYASGPQQGYQQQGGYSGSGGQGGGYQGRPPQGYQGGPPQGGYQGGPPQNQGGGYQYQNQGPQPEVSGNQFQGQTHYQSGPQHGGQGQQHPFVGGPPTQAQHPYTKTQQPLRRKSLLIGINYVGTKNALRGCHQDVTNMTDFLKFKGYSSDPKSQVIMRDDQKTDPRGQYYPNGKNILAAMHWLVSEPNTCNFLHYSGHGGQVKDPDGDRDSGFDDTIVPIDFESKGQIDSDKLHRTLVSALPANSTLFVIFDCCHSGSAIELPFVFRSDADGNVSLLDNVKTGMGLLQEASSLIQGGFTMDKLVHAKELFAGASTFFKQLQHSGEEQEEGVGEEHFVEDWKSEHKFVTMFSGCRDDQTSADASIGGASVGAMSWAFLETMKRNPNPTYLNTLQQTRQTLGQSNYKQVPQLSIGFKELDLNQPLRF